MRGGVGVGQGGGCDSCDSCEGLTLFKSQSKPFQLFKHAAMPQGPRLTSHSSRNPLSAHTRTHQGRPGCRLDWLPPSLIRIALQYTGSRTRPLQESTCLGDIWLRLEWHWHCPVGTRSLLSTGSTRRCHLGCSDR